MIKKFLTLLFLVPVCSVLADETAIPSTPFTRSFMRANTAAAARAYLQLTNVSYGVPGTNGVNGLPGTNGVNGGTGPAGTSGTNGVSGTNSVNGATGPAGTSGTNGANGTNGVNGVNGTNTVAGVSTNFISQLYAVQNQIINIPHHLLSTPVFIQWFLYCATNDSGYTVGDILPLQSQDDNPPVVASFGANSTNIFAVLENVSLFQVFNKSTGSKASLNLARWQVFCDAACILTNGVGTIVTVNGTNGVNGSQGLPGTNGMDGAPGPPGTGTTYSFSSNFSVSGTNVDVINTPHASSADTATSWAGNGVLTGWSDSGGDYFISNVLTGEFIEQFANGDYFETNPVSGSFFSRIGGSSSTSGSNSAAAYYGPLHGQADTSTGLAFDFYPETYGGKGDGTRLFGVISTNGSATISCATANFTTNDVGKAFLLYQDLTNVTSVSGTILTFVSATSVTVSSNAIATRTNNTLIYGTDNTLAISNCIAAAYAAHGGAIKFRNAMYVCAGAVQGGSPDGTYAVFHLPTSQGFNMATNIAIELDGPFTPSLSYTAQTNIGMSGAILYSFAKPHDANVDTFFTCGNTTFVLEQYKLKNLTIRQPVYPTLNLLYAPSGGGYIVEDCALDVEFPVGSLINNIPNCIPPTNSTRNIRAAAALWPPYTSNNSDVRLRNVLIAGYPTAVFMTEHTFADNLEIQNCGTALVAACSDTGIGSVIHGCHILSCYVPIHVWATDMTGPSVVDWQSLSIECHGWPTATYYDPSNVWNTLGGGWISYENDAWIGPLPAMVNVIPLAGNLSSPLHLVGNAYSDIGFDALNKGVIFDLPMIPNTPTQVYTRDKNNILLQLNTGVIAFTNSPDGDAMLFASGQSISTSLITNVVNGLTNVTVDLLVWATTNAAITYPLTEKSGNNVIQFNYANSAVYCSWKTTTTNGSVGLQVQMPYTLADGTWHEMTGTYSAQGTNMIFYVDGAMVGTAWQTGPLAQASDVLVFGDGASSASVPTAIAHPRIWNRVLGPAEIQNMALKRGLGKLPTAVKVNYTSFVATNSPSNGNALRYTNGNFYWGP